MLAKTPGIVIRNTRYGEGSIISKIYTREFGMQSYMVNGVFGAKSGLKASLFQPMMLLDMVVYHNHLKDIQRIKEAKGTPQLLQVHFNVVKSSIGLFVSELLNKAIKEEEPNEKVYDFIADFLVRLDDAGENLALWPVWFMTGLARYLGFHPTNNFDATENNYFDLQEGSFTSFPQKRDHAIGPPESEYFSKLIQLDIGDLSSTHFPKPIRTEILNKLIIYYKLHLPDFKDIRSVEVLASL